MCQLAPIKPGTSVTMGEAAGSWSGYNQPPLQTISALKHWLSRVCSSSTYYTMATWENIFLGVK